LAGPALSLHGTADRTADITSVDLLARWTPRIDWTQVRIDGAPHQLCTSHWRGRVADEVARFLDDARRMIRRVDVG
jgi:pimeloyl-ACP methyl ester carboxylesterase